MSYCFRLKLHHLRLPPYYDCTSKIVIDLLSSSDQHTDIFMNAIQNSKDTVLLQEDGCHEHVLQMATFFKKQIVINVVKP